MDLKRILICVAVAAFVHTLGKGFGVLFRLYGPEKPFFDKVWKLPDIERAK